ncbi:hypothetical protein EC991_002361 [Linnemannia zychae]|nr:hypothetical protein EC991_002361 [Linnemannia zychae]
MELPPPELIDEPKHSYHDHSSLDPLPKMAASIERRPSQAPQRIKRSVYRTILDWSVHPTVQPTDFVALPDLPRTTPSLPARAGKFVKLPAVSVAATANTTSADSGDTSDKDVTKKRYVSRRRIGFDDDDDDDLLDTKLRSRQRRPSVIRLEQNSEPRSAPPSPAPLPPLPSTADHPRQTTTQVLDAIVKHRLGQNSDAQGNPWSISGIRKQKFSLGEKEKSGLLRRPVFGHSDKPEKDEPLKETTVTTAASKPFQSSLPFVSSPPRAEQIMKAVLPDQPLLSFWRKPLVDTPQHTTKQSQDSAGEYIFSPRAVLPALTTGLRKPFELLYIDSIKHSRISQMVQECVDTAKEMGLNVVKTTPEKLNSLIGHQAHQGVVLRASYLPKAVVKSMGVVSDDNTYDLQFARGPAKKFHGSATVPANNKSIESGMASGRAVAESSSPLPPPIWIVLDEIQTIYDMGQILNAAYHFGIDGVLIKDRNTVSPLAGVSAASGGALEKRPAYAIHSIIKFIKESQANGWQVIGIKAAYGSKRMKPFYKFPSTGINRPTVLVVGSDGLELQKSVGRHCDGFIHVPTLARMTTEANTLPVSVVSGIVMSRLVADRLGTAAAAGDEKKRAFVDKSRNERAVDDDDYISPDPWVEGASPPEWEEVAFGLKPKGIRYSNNRNAGKF